ncbi:DUF1972 domain-containing protein [Pedobacter sp. HMF7647]|uniref:DUF1972 domain-containing protein n=1 Tax=Hufsiella arboris TaxID=2695275 RepID=A0A7K1Y7V8_9SPHI|nr:DUF1972 domain-containing protein [Hufsiella arboris]MXV50199.1 DUF1972 domain-containing protein [Hufsiella arboris]
MYIAILGTRGIPNNYGGFEQCAEYLAKGLVEKGYRVAVYNSHNHPYQEKAWSGAEIIHCYDPEDKLGTAGQFIYDLNCVRDARRRNFDIILQLGYTSSSIWGWLMPKSSIVTTNMDGLEWKRTKYSDNVRRFLLYAEKLGVKYSKHLIADSVGIKNYLKEKYNAESDFIPYGAHLFNEPDESQLLDYKVKPFEYNMLIARLEPENSIEIILDGVAKADKKKEFLVIGKHETEYGDFLKNKFAKHAHIRFIGGVYSMGRLNNLRYYSNIYFHGHTVGGTNPSLLEAMASDSFICANENPFNHYILEDDSLYFSTADDVTMVLDNFSKGDKKAEIMIANNRNKISNLYDWDIITYQYANHFEEIYKAKFNQSISYGYQ